MRRNVTGMIIEGQRNGASSDPRSGAIHCQMALCVRASVASCCLPARVVGLSKDGLYATRQISTRRTLAWRGAIHLKVNPAPGCELGAKPGQRVRQRLIANHSSDEGVSRRALRTGKIIHVIA